MFQSQRRCLKRNRISSSAVFHPFVKNVSPSLRPSPSPPSSPPLLPSRFKPFILPPVGPSSFLQQTDSVAAETGSGISLIWCVWRPVDLSNLLYYVQIYLMYRTHLINQIFIGFINPFIPSSMFCSVLFSFLAFNPVRWRFGCKP